jgi:citrate lyase synthetase
LLHLPLLGQVLNNPYRKHSIPPFVKIHARNTAFAPKFPLFGTVIKEIIFAACLDIRARYAGEEPTSRVTGIYNEIMARRLPELGIRCRIIPRMERDGRPVSASTVRQAIHDGELNRAMALLPPSGQRFFASPEAAPVIAAIQAQQNVIHH